MLKNTPGVTLSQTSPTVYNNLAIRGILTENRTNYRLDGMLPVINLIDLGLEDKERIEALKARRRSIMASRRRRASSTWR